MSGKGTSGSAPTRKSWRLCACQWKIKRPRAWNWALGALALAGWFLAANLLLQYGAARLPANATAVIMVTEVLFAGVSAVALGAGTLSTTLLVGGALIVAGALLSARE